MYSLVESDKSDGEFALPLFVIGRAVRTRNDVEMTEEAKVPDLWRRVMADTALANLPGRVGDEYYAVLNDYDTDQHGWYTKVIGVGVQHLIDIPQDLVAVSIPHRRRLVFEALSDMPAALARVWERVWDHQPTETKRRVATDVEIHHPDGGIHILAVSAKEGLGE